jgi:uncharacterized RDD family membrane protein YckC
MAWGIDCLVAFAVLFVFVSATSVFNGIPTLQNATVGVMMLLLFALQWGYGVVFETVLSGRTPGKMAMSLRVVREDGAPARFPDFALRNLLRTADFMPIAFGVGAVVMLADAKLRRIGDLVAGTVVVVEERASVLGNVVIAPPVTEAERQAMPPRVDLSRDEIHAIEAFLRRRPLLSPERAEELAVLFGPALAERTGLEAPTWERVLTLAYARATGKDR